VSSTDPACEGLEVHDSVSKSDQRPHRNHRQCQHDRPHARHKLRTPKLLLHVRQRWSIVQYHKTLQTQLTTTTTRLVIYDHRTGLGASAPKLKVSPQLSAAILHYRLPVPQDQIEEPTTLLPSFPLHQMSHILIHNYCFQILFPRPYWETHNSPRIL